MTQTAPIYHYTSEESLIEMGRTGLIYPSSSLGDAAFGDGLYGTSLPPLTSTEILLCNNYDGSITMTSPAKTSCYLKFDRKKNCFQQCPTFNDRIIYLYRCNANVPIRIDEADCFGFRSTEMNCFGVPIVKYVEYTINCIKNYLWVKFYYMGLFQRCQSPQIPFPLIYPHSLSYVPSFALQQQQSKWL